MENASLIIPVTMKAGVRMQRVAYVGMLAALLIVAAPAESQVAPAPDPITYADLADLSLTAPVAAHVRITRALRLKGDDALAVTAGKTRFYVEAEVVSLIRAPQGLPAAISYLVDLPHNETGKPAKLAKKTDYLLLGDTVAGRAGEIRLTAPDAHLAWTAARGDRLRAILRESASAQAAPRITGIGRAFNVPGSLPGESETQIFLQTADGLPVSLSILRRPGETPRWAVALAEIVDEAAAPPRPDTLLWYRLACTLPPTLPAQSLAEADPAQEAAIRADYRLVLDRLGPCARGRTRG